MYRKRERQISLYISLSHYMFIYLYISVVLHNILYHRSQGPRRTVLPLTELRSGDAIDWR